MNLACRDTVQSTANPLSMGYLFTLLIVSFNIKKLNILIYPVYLFFFLLPMVLAISKNSLPNPEAFPLSSKSFKGLALMFRSLIYFELIFVYGLK